MLLAYLSDGWARVAHERFGTVLGVHVRITREGLCRNEFLLQRSSLLCDTFDGGELVRILVDEPRGLRLGAALGQVFTAATEFCSTLRQMGQEGTAWNVYVQDGLLHPSLTRMFRGSP